MIRLWCGGYSGEDFGLDSESLEGSGTLINGEQPTWVNQLILSGPHCLWHSYIQVGSWPTHSRFTILTVDTVIQNTTHSSLHVAQFSWRACLVLIMTTLGLKIVQSIVILCAFPHQQNIDLFTAKIWKILDIFATHLCSLSLKTLFQ